MKGKYMKLLEFIVKSFMVIALPGVLIIASCFAPDANNRELFGRMAALVGFFDIIPLIMVVAGSNQKEAAK